MADPRTERWKKLMSQKVGFPVDENTDLDIDRYADQVNNYSEIMEESVFLGEYPLTTILEGIEEQFSNYIDMEDTTDYVDIFYDQWNASYKAVVYDEEEDHPQELLEALDRIKTKFVDKVTSLFSLRLTITVSAVDDEETEEDEVELALRKIYTYFILNARNNFKVAIAKDMIGKIGNIADEDLYFKKVQDLLLEYSPLLKMTPTQFMKYIGDDELIEMYDNGIVSGNFLRKYSPKFYQNEEFEVEVINYITIVKQLKEELVNGQQ